MFDQNQSNQNLGQVGVTPPQSQPLTSSNPGLPANDQEASNPWLKQASASTQAVPTQASYGNTNQPEDMFATTRDIPAPGNFNNQYGQADQDYSQMPPAMNYGDIYGGKGINFGKVIMILSGLLLIVLVAVAAYFAYNYFASQDLAEEVENQEIIVNEPAANTPSQSNQENNTQNQVVVPAIPEASTSTQAQTVVSSEKDSDGDGLTDAEELELKTNPSSADTDSDGLTDWAEIKIYKTDPLDPDSDGDGYKDGEEVINGYDPAKSGGARLFEVPQQ